MKNKIKKIIKNLFFQKIIISVLITILFTNIAIIGIFFFLKLRISQGWFLIPVVWGALFVSGVLISFYLIKEKFLSKSNDNDIIEVHSSVIEELKETNDIHLNTIHQLEEKIEHDKLINNAMTQYFDALYKELILVLDEKDKEKKKDQLIDRIMEMIYDNIHLAFESIVKDKTREVESMKQALNNKIQELK